MSQQEGVGKLEPEDKDMNAMKPSKYREENDHDSPSSLATPSTSAQEASRRLSSTGSLLVYRKEQDEEEEQGQIARQHTIRAMVIEPSQDGFPATSLSQELLPDYTADHKETYADPDASHGGHFAAEASSTPRWSNTPHSAEMATHPELPSAPHTPSAASHSFAMSHSPKFPDNDWNLVVTELEGGVVQGNELVTQEMLPWMEGISAIHALLRSHFPEETVHMEMKADKHRLTSVNFDEGIVVMSTAPASRNRREFEEVARQIHQRMNSR